MSYKVTVDSGTEAKKNSVKKINVPYINSKKLTTIYEWAERRVR